MPDILKLINKNYPGKRCKINMAAAEEAAKIYSFVVETIPKKDAGPGAKAPAVYLNDKLLAETGGLRNGKVTHEELVKELAEANVPKKSAGRSSCAVFLDD
ncbi:MAG TPA: hypothetical protein ENH31_03645 [Nitrospirae bacterium]|nr:hypothetical protein BMS3Abin10_01739 [bacterium BMS3Abin10]GBE39116.1 hypothetical protein BMS3Bbin08_01734 [bacterium BMS3Bbin08]HDH51317.1 hypothetical protein [Nitrospirota bacterium]HDK81647.1 hypothetical protein [Nitrospirota bacterium]